MSTVDHLGDFSHRLRVAAFLPYLDVEAVGLVGLDDENSQLANRCKFRLLQRAVGLYFFRNRSSDRGV